jgi:Holliday junction resolvasome RuvABC endonuclease subunit
VSCVVGIDLSTRAIDLVRLDETSNQGTWDHLHLEGKTALERLRQVPRVMPRRSLYWESVYLIAVEAPMSRGQQGTMAKLSRVLGAIVACLPAGVEVWEVAPVQWRKELGLSGHASKEQAAEAVDALRGPGSVVWTQDALDAYAVAYYARELNARALGGQVA